MNNLTAVFFNKLSKFSFMNLFVFLLLYIAIYFIEYNSIDVAVLLFLILGIVLILVNREFAFIFYIFTIYIFDDMTFCISVPTLIICFQSSY